MNATQRSLSGITTAMVQAIEMLDTAIKEGQRCLKKSPVIVLGSGASVSAGLPSMKELADHLKDSCPNWELSKKDRKSWSKLIAEISNKDLESALQTVQLNEKLSDHVVEQTWNLISKADTCVFENILGNMNHLPLGKLYQYLFKCTNRKVSVVTTNYDRLAEYAADCVKCCHYTGFSYGYLRRREQSDSRLTFKQGREAARTVNIWKVHGCLDWFIDQDDKVLALTSARTIPNGWKPAIVTPGINKYESTHSEPFRSIIAGADKALAGAAAYLCVGFGFNDMHIQPKLLDRWKQGNAFLVILARTLSESAKNMFKRAGDQEFLGLEKGENGMCMWSHKHREGTQLDEINLWDLQEFLRHMLPRGA